MSSLGRVLAESVVSPSTIPPWPNSSMDGYAVRSHDTGRAPVELAVVGRIIAGSMPSRPLRAGEAMRIFTGAPLPDGADAVVPQEDVAADGERVTIRGRIETGACVRPAGEDVRVGDVVVQPGHVVGAAEVGLLATLGYSQVRVFRRPRVAVLSTGNELADLGTEPTPGQIPNTNTYSLMAQVLEAGAEPINLGVAPDRLESITERLQWGLAADVLVTSAGVSVGELDLVRDALERCGAELHLWQVSMRPGKPITFGTRAARQSGLGDGDLRAFRAPGAAPDGGRPRRRSAARPCPRAGRDLEPRIPPRLPARDADARYERLRRPPHRRPGLG